MIYRYGAEECKNCGSDNVITLNDDNGSYDYCNDCGWKKYILSLNAEETKRRNQNEGKMYQ